MRKALLKQTKRIVLKIGSGIIASREQGLNTSRIEQLAKEVAQIREAGYQILLVSSGAILSGLKKLGLTERPKTLPVKQAAAAVGQSRLMWAYEHAFDQAGIKVAQILLTHEDLSNRSRFLASRNTLSALLDWDVVPVINENDTVSTEEIRFGDNDHLASLVAHLVDARLLVILSDVDGLYTENPQKNPEARWIPEVEKVTPEIERMAGGAVNFGSTGGMLSKVRAAKQAAAYGVATLIIGGSVPGRVFEALSGAEIGTFFFPNEQKLNSRQHWIAYTLKPKGRLHLDSGAVEALAKKGKSLLPSGVREVTGRFDPGDAVSCLGPDGEEFARGLVNYGSVELIKIKGAKSAEIAKILGHKDYDEVIHRDNLVIL
jgi:glutamate 5-kinase